MMASHAIRLENVWKKYGSVHALCGATFEVPEGSIFALIGPNGAGKTTAIKTALNLAKPTRGRAEILGFESHDLRPRLFELIGYVSENQELPDWMTVDYFLSYCRQFYPSWSDAEASSLMVGFDLPPRRRLRDLSRGMRMKTALVSSLAYKPRLLVLDEPFSGLDVLVRDELTETILERETTVFIASHDLSDLESFASHVAYLSDGRILFAEEIASLMQRFREVEVMVEGSTELPSFLPATWLSLERLPTVIRFTDSQFRDEARIAELFPKVRDVQVRPMSLRSIFIALAKGVR
jgi:ABC-2 type transport system ATP-binding protein